MDFEKIAQMGAEKRRKKAQAQKTLSKLVNQRLKEIRAMKLHGNPKEYKMLSLEESTAPIEDIITTQPQVVVKWEKDCLGQGVLYLTKTYVQWICDSTRKGFRLNYPAISVHAVAGINEQNPEPSLFLMIDVNKTDIDYTPDAEYVEEEEDPAIKTAAIWLIPANPSIVQELFETMNTCQMENPDLDDDQISEDFFGDEQQADSDEIIDSNGDHHLSNSGNWFTTDTSTDEILLSAEGRANLERMLGNLNDDNSNGPPTSENGQQPPENMEE